MSPVLTQKQRREKIKENIVTYTYSEIAKLCGVTKRTIRRDIERWKRQGGYDEFLTEQFFKLYGLVKTKNVEHAFDRICDLMRRRQESIPMQKLDADYEVVFRWKRKNETTPKT